MTSASTEKLQNGVVHCPICLHTPTEPQMFGCFHFYCQKCVHDMKEAKQGEKVGYECPLCRKFTAEDQLKALPIMNQLIEALEATKNEVFKCGKCKSSAPTQRCLDCKENYCDECRDHHDEFKLFRTHTWKVIDDDRKPIIDDLLFCQLHPTEQLKLHCRDCQLLICVLCNGTTHKQHTAETIEEALDDILPVVRENQVKVKAVIEATKSDIAETKLKQKASKQVFDAMKRSVTEKFKELMKKAIEDHANLCKQINILEEENADKHEARVKQLNLHLQSQENVLSLSQSTLDTAQNISLLKALQSGVLDSLRGSLEGSDTVPEVEDHNAAFYGSLSKEENLLGSVNVKRPVNISCELEISCDELMTKTFTLQSQHSIRFRCYRFDVINDELWCVEFDSSNIHVISTNGAKQCTLWSSDGFDEAWSVIAFKDKALVSAKNGLFTVSTSKPHDVVKVFDGNFCDTSVTGEKLFALQQKSSKIYVIQATEQCEKLVKEREFPLQKYHGNLFNTIQATSDHVFIALFGRPSIHQYTLDGELVREHGRHGNDIGELFWPFLSGSDLFNNILIAGNSNDRLDVLRADGSFCTLPVTGLGRKPKCARIHEGMLYVVHQHESKLQVFRVD